MMQYQRGDLEAFDTLYLRHSGKIFAFFKNRISEPSTAEDLLVSTFLELHRSREKYDPGLPFLAWMFSICYRDIHKSWMPDFRSFLETEPMKIGDAISRRIRESVRKN